MTGRLTMDGVTSAVAAVLSRMGLPERCLVQRCIAQPNHFRCPHCDSIVYSRRNPLCGLCGILLPKEFLFTAEESERVTGMLVRERSRHRQWIAQKLD